MEDERDDNLVEELGADRESNSPSTYGTSNVSFILTNACSLLNKLTETTALINQCHSDVVGITETWTHPDVVDSEIRMDGYNVMRMDRNGSRNGGGCLLYIEDRLEFTLVAYLQTNFIA